MPIKIPEDLPARNADEGKYICNGRGKGNTSGCKTT